MGDLKSTCIVIIILIILLYKGDIERFTNDILSNNTTRICSNINGGCYRVQKKYDPETYVGAANILDSINERNIVLLRHLKKKYIDTDNGENRSAEFRKRKKWVNNLLRRYNPGSIIEHAPSSTRNTSYVLSKGEEIGYCLREKETGHNYLHSIDQVYFVNLHEMSHLASDRYNPRHTTYFWKVFKFILNEAVEAGVYSPINYSMKPMKYCGIYVDYNPYFIQDL
jgi:hypothetical protein